MEFNPARHDFGDKQLLGITVKSQGEAELNQMLDLLARHPSTARFVSRKLAQYFVADEPPPALVERMAERWQQSDGRIAEVLRAMIGSPEFEASLARTLKDPTHYVVSAVRLAYAHKVVLNTAPMIGWLYRLGHAQIAPSPTVDRSPPLEPAMPASIETHDDLLHSGHNAACPLGPPSGTLRCRTWGMP